MRTSSGLWKNIREHWPPCSQFNIRDSVSFSLAAHHLIGHWFVIFPLCLHSQAQLDLTNHNHKNNYRPGCSDHRLTTTLLLLMAKQKRCSEYKEPFQNKNNTPVGFSIWMRPLCHCVFCAGQRRSLFLQIRRWNYIRTVSVLVLIKHLQACVFHPPRCVKQTTTQTSSFSSRHGHQSALEMPKQHPGGHGSASAKHGPCSLKDNVYLL